MPQRAGRNFSKLVALRGYTRDRFRRARMESAVIFPHHRVVRISGAVVFAVALATALPASAQGLFDFLFGGARRPSPPSSTSSYADPFGNRTYLGPRVESGAAMSFCVRLCDGRYFPIQRSSGANAAQVCSAFCPATNTKVFAGGAIDYASASDGSRYKDLPNAFAYRERTVPGCTCNGKDPYGLVTTDAGEDPTLRAGDIVGTEQGFVAYTGGRGRRNADFTPIDSHSGLSAELRQRLAGARIVPRNATPVPEPGDATAAVDRRVQSER